MTVAQRMTGPLIDAATRLAELLEAENAALAALDLPRAGAMLAAKREAVAALEAAQRIAVPASLSQGTIEAALRRVDAAAAENRRLLRRAIAAQAGVLAAIARAARSTPARRYGAGGQAAPGRAAAMALSARA